MEGVDYRAVGIATPAVLTKEMAEDCADYVTSLVLMVGRTRVWCVCVCVCVCVECVCVCARARACVCPCM
jgi:hypothetical protein